MTLGAAPAIILIVHVLTVTANYGANSLLSSMAKLVLHWNVYEDGHYPAFAQLCMFITFFGIFPALHSIYNFVVMNNNETEGRMDQTTLVGPRKRSCTRVRTKL
ncbi:hypothetical protein BGZ47_001385 [Haplosporangium gracile]|nr:hypothetical protein BGZ47_001385 [Haplosporangium gracile]